MKILRIFCFVLILTIPSSGIGKTGPAVEASGPVRILFIGNSLTYFNDLPAVLEQIANYDDTVRVKTAMIASGGATLKQHWEEGKAADAIAASQWDYVVLQEQSQLGGRDVDGARKMNTPEMFFEISRAFDGAIRKSGAQTAFLLTWSHKDKPEEQALLDDAYGAIASELGAVLAPAGKAWRRMRGSEIELYYDNVHPNFNGTYLSALVVGMTLVPDFPRSGGSVFEFRVAAEEPPASLFETVAITPAVAAELQRAAQEVVKSKP